MLSTALATCVLREPNSWKPVLVAGVAELMNKDRRLMVRFAWVLETSEDGLICVLDMVLSEEGTTICSVWVILLCLRVCQDALLHN